MGRLGPPADPHGMATKTTAYNINRLTQTTDILRVRSAATTICIRRAPAGSAARSVLTREEVAGPGVRGAVAHSLLELFML